MKPQEIIINLSITKTNLSIVMNERLTKLFLSGLIIAIPVFAIVKAKADMERNKPSEYMPKEYTPYSVNQSNPHKY